MMRCIQVALDNGVITPDEARMLNQRVSGLLREGLAPPDVKAQIVERLSFEAQEAERTALIVEGKRQQLTNDVLNHKNAKGENDPAEALWLLMGRQGHAAKFQDIETLQGVIYRRVHKDLEAALFEFRKRFWTGDTRASRAKHEPRLRNVLSEVMNATVSRTTNEVFLPTTKKTGDPTARAYAEAWLKASDYLRQRSAIWMMLRRPVHVTWRRSSG